MAVIAFFVITAKSWKLGSDTVKLYSFVVYHDFL